VGSLPYPCTQVLRGLAREIGMGYSSYADTHKPGVQCLARSTPNIALEEFPKDRLFVHERAVFLLQTLFVPASWAVPCIVPYGPPVVNNWVHARTRRVPTEIVRDPATSLKLPPDPQHLGICSASEIDLISRPFGWLNPQHLVVVGAANAVMGRFEPKSDVIISVIGKRGGAQSDALIL
jgi:hypothetical protein